MLRSLRAVMRKELIQTMRDPRMLPIILMAPMVQVVVLGFAINLDLKNQPLVVVDLDRSPQSREILRGLEHIEEMA